MGDNKKQLPPSMIQTIPGVIVSIIATCIYVVVIAIPLSSELALQWPFEGILTILLFVIGILVWVYSQRWYYQNLMHEIF